MQTPAAITSDTRPALDVLVVGAGQAGLSLAWFLEQAGARYLLVDAHHDVGASWRSRWDSLRLFTPARYDALPGSTFPGDPDAHPTKDQVADYLASYAETNAFPILSGTTVQRVTRHHDAFEVATSQGAIRAARVVVATGAFHTPRVPDIADGFGTTPQVHSSEYRRPADIPAGTVLVVGAANSGLQIAEDLVATHRVVVAVGTRPPVVPQRIAGRDLFWWLTRTRLIDAGATSLLARRMRARGDLVVGTRPAQLERRGVAFRPRLAAADGGVARFSDHSTLRPDAVIWATGYRPDYGWLDIPDVTDADGQPRHDQGRSLAADGLWFLGTPWQRARGSSLLGFVQRDARYVASHLN